MAKQSTKLTRRTDSSLSTYEHARESDPTQTRRGDHPLVSVPRIVRGMRLPGDMITADELACAAWPHAVGKKVARHTRAANFVRTRLVIEVEDLTWRRQLFALSSQILRNLDRYLGHGLVEDLEFRIVPRKRDPQRASLPQPALLADESNDIADPLMRSIYRASRKKAQA